MSIIIVVEKGGKGLEVPMEAPRAFKLKCNHRHFLYAARV